MPGCVNMDETLPAGKLGEQLIQKLYTNRGYVVKDVSDDEEKQKLGYDMVVYPPEEAILQWEDENGPIPRKGFTVEVKTDSRIWTTGNLFAELAVLRPATETREAYTQDGWMKTSKASLLAYIDARGGIVYFIDLRALKRYISEHIGELKEVTAPNPYDEGSFCSGYLVPLCKLLQDSACVAGHTLVDSRDIAFPKRLAQ